MSDNEIVETCVGFWNCVSPDAWVSSTGTLLGAFLGALLAGLISLKISKRNIEIDERREKVNELEKFLKFNEKYEKNLVGIIGNFNVIKTAIEEEDYQRISIPYTSNLNYIQSQLKMDTHPLSYKAEKIVNDINHLTSYLTFQVSIFTRNNDPNTLKNFGGNLKEYIDKVEELKKYKESLNK